MNESHPPEPARGWPVAIAVVVLVALSLGVWADRSTSLTFDEPVLVGIGARAVMAGEMEMLVDQPPLLALLQGAAVATLRPTLPDPPPGVEGWNYALRYPHGRALFFGGDNRPRALATAARSISLAALVLLLLLVAAWGRGLAGWPAACGAALLTAFVPDVLAHGAIAYNDLPLAPAFLAAVWAADRMARRPTPGSGALFGAAFGVAMAIKYSAVALAPVAVLLVGLQALADRRADPRAWTRAAVGALVAFWAVTAVVWGGDLGLTRFLEGFWFQMEHAADGHPAPAWVLGATSADGWWWYFPIAYLFKIPVGLQLLGLTVVVTGARTLIGEAATGGWVSRRAADPLRGPLVAIAVYGAFLLRSNLNIGFRYVLPILPLIALVVAVGVVRSGALERARPRVLVGALVLMHMASTLSVAPHFLAFESLPVRDRPAGAEVLLDSNLDWGQGLLALADWMEAEGVPAVNLSYFGSALPEGYGVAYRSLPSFLPLPAGAGVAPGAPPPEWTAISATNLPGLYLEGDPFVAYRSRPPDVTLAGGAIHLWRKRAP